MIVISAGLPKSGTALYFNLTNDLLVRSGKPDVREVQKEYLGSILQYENCNMQDITFPKVMKLLMTQVQVGSFVVKTHYPPTPALTFFSSLKLVKSTYIYRDPRDVVLSAIDHAEKIRRKGQDHVLTTCKDVHSTIPVVKGWLDYTVHQWLDLDNVLKVKYEDLVTDPLHELKRLAEFLNIDVSPIDLGALYKKYDKGFLDSSKADSLHFNHGIVNRFRSIMSKDELEQCAKEFAPYLNTLGYPA